MLLALFIAAIAIIVAYLYGRLNYKRLRQYASFPQVQPSLFLGHLKKIDDYIKAGKPNGHPDLAFVAMNESLGRPPLMLVDLRPIGPPMVIVRSHDVAEQVSKPTKSFPHSLPKMSEVYSHMAHVTGQSSILGADGEDWKLLRKRFNPGFASQHLLTFLPCILDKSFTFLKNLEELAKSNQPFSLIEVTSKLIFDVISSVTMDQNFFPQDPEHPSGFSLAYRELLETYASEQMDLPWYFTPRTEWKRRNLSKNLREKLKSIIEEAFLTRQAESTKSRTILSLSLQDIEELTPQILDETCDQLSTFLFAGHDTTAILLSWIFYELSRTPHALKAVRDELDILFGPESDYCSIRDFLLMEGGQELLSKMTYTAAVIKETLRLWPPAGTARMTRPGAGIRVQTSIGDYSLEGVSVYNCAILIQRDPEVYGDTANDFLPERWLDNSANQIPASAWRAFERGPRNCIGQELVAIEARVIIALVARRFDFIKVGTGELAVDNAGKPMLDSKGYYEVVSEMYPTRQVTPKPVDGMMMKVKVR